MSPSAVKPLLPADPQPGTGLAGPLVPASLYRQLTGDTAADPADVTDAVEAATTFVAQRTHRTLKFGQYVETLYVYKRGMVYPSAVPISQVDDPAGVYQQGSGLWVGFFLPLPSMPIFTGVVPPQTQVTYWGGFDADTVGQVPDLPRVIAKLAWYRLHPQAQPGLPAGATNVAAGGVSLAGDLGPFAWADSDVKAFLQRFRRPQVRGWRS